MSHKNDQAGPELLCPENRFRNLQIDRIVAPPEVGFIFPAFDDRCANIYNALYYSKNPAGNHPELAEAIFKTGLPMPADEQKETFESILEDTLSEDCNLEVRTGGTNPAV